jgi:hypothetical protein
MYCSNCGAKVEGNFCSQCGAKVSSDNSASVDTIRDIGSENKYTALIKRADIRDLIAKYAQLSPHHLSAQDFLHLLDLAYKPIPGLSLSKLTEVVLPVFNKLGIKTGKSSVSIISSTASDVVIKVLCSLAKNGYALKSVDPASNGLIVHAEISSDFFTWGGDILIVIEEQSLTTKLSIDATIKGQLYDWGKSKGVINKILNDVASISI